MFLSAYLPESEVEVESASEAGPQSEVESESGTERLQEGGGGGGGERRGTLVGYAKLTKPASMRIESTARQSQGLSQNRQNGVPAATDASKEEEDDMQGVDVDALKAWRAAQAEVSRQYPHAEECYVL